MMLLWYVACRYICSAHKRFVLHSKKKTVKPHRIILLFGMLLMGIACSSEKENNHAKIIWDSYDNGNYKTVHQYFTDTANFSEDYSYQAYYENGNLKIQGLENHGVRKGEWNMYFENGAVKAKLAFDNGTLHGPIELYNENGTIKATDIAEYGQLKSNNGVIKQFIQEHFDSPENNVNWHDSLDVMVDSLKRTLDKVKE